MSEKPKPYDWVPFPKEKPHRREPTSFLRFEDGRLTGRLVLGIKLESRYLYVGSGQLEARKVKVDDEEVQVPVWCFARSRGKPIIPGTSLKGSIRSILEALSNSCVGIRHRGDDRKHIPPSHQPCRYENPKSPLCPACRIFGTTGFAGRVHFMDAQLLSGTKLEVICAPQLFPPKPQRGRKFYRPGATPDYSKLEPKEGFQYLEVVQRNKEGEQFQTEMFFRNISRAELALVLYALGFENQGGKLGHAFFIRLGGEKPHSFGVVRFIPKQVQLWERNNLKFSAPSEHEVAERWAVQLLTEYTPERLSNERLLHASSYGRVKQILQIPTGSRPSGD